MKSISASQPTYLPWIGYFALIASVDEFVFMDEAQLVKRSWAVRNRIYSSGGELMLTVPISRVGSRETTTINSAKISSDSDWVRKHVASIKHSYQSAPFVNDFLAIFEPIINAEISNLGNLNIGIISAFCNALGIDTRLDKTSNMATPKSSKEAWLIDICLEKRAGLYLSSLGSSSYLEVEKERGKYVSDKFLASDISLKYQNYGHPDYVQMNNKTRFVPYMSIVDLVVNLGWAASKDLILSGIKEPLSPQDVRKGTLGKTDKSS